MKLARATFTFLVFIISCTVGLSQNPATKQYKKDGLRFDYLSSWTLLDDSNSDAQQLTLMRSDSAAQIRIFVRRGRVTPEKLPKTRKEVVDSYIEATVKQFIAMGANPEQSPDSIDIGTTKAEGVNVKASLGGDPGAARIYWTLLGERIVVLTYFGPDKEMAKHTGVWDLVRSSFQIEEKSPTPKPSPTQQ